MKKIDYLIMVRNRSLMFCQMTLGSKRDSATFTSKWSLEVMNVDMQP